MTGTLPPIRRVVTGNDEQGRSRVLFDSAAPNVVPQAVRPNAGMTDIWVYPTCPADISGDRDDGNLPFQFEPPAQGGHLRIVHAGARARDYDPATDTAVVPLHAPIRGHGGTWERGGQGRRCNHPSARARSQGWPANPRPQGIP